MALISPKSVPVIAVNVPVRKMLNSFALLTIDKLQLLLFGLSWDKYFLGKTVDFKTVKRQKARSRMRLAREAARSPEAAAVIQKRVSLVGDGAKWEITNLKEFVHAAAARWT